MPRSHGARRIGEFALALVAAVGCSVAPDTLDGSSMATKPMPSAPSPVTSAPEPSPTAEPDPPYSTHLADHLDCEGPVAPIGAANDPLNGSLVAMGRTLENSVKAFLGDEVGFYATLPLEGWVLVDQSEHWALVGHVVDGHRKVLASFTDRLEPPMWSGWQVVSCDASEFMPGTRLGLDTRIWVDEFAGSPIPTTKLFERADCYGARVLRLDGQLFVRDPEGAMDPASLLDTYDGDAPVDENMIPTGYRDGNRFLFLDPEVRSIYVVIGQKIERWPRVRGDEIVRVDCN